MEALIDPAISSTGGTMRKTKQIVLIVLCILSGSALGGALGYFLACGLID